MEECRGSTMKVLSSFVLTKVRLDKRRVVPSKDCDEIQTTPQTAQSNNHDLTNHTLHRPKYSEEYRSWMMVNNTPRKKSPCPDNATRRGNKKENNGPA